MYSSSSTLTALPIMEVAKPHCGPRSRSCRARSPGSASGRGPSPAARRMHGSSGRATTGSAARRAGCTRPPAAPAPRPPRAGSVQRPPGRGRASGRPQWIAWVTRGRPEGPWAFSSLVPNPLVAVPLAPQPGVHVVLAEATDGLHHLDSRRISPSVTTGSPARSCSPMARSTARSSIRLNSAAVRPPAA